MISASVHLLLAYRKATDLCKLIQYSTTLLNLSIIFRDFSGRIFGISIVQHHIIYKQGQFDVLFPYLYPFNFLCIPGTSNTLLKRKGASWQPCLSQTSVGLLQTFLHLGYCWLWVSYYVEMYSLQPSILQTFIMKACCVLSKAFSAPIVLSCDFCLQVHLYGLLHLLTCICLPSLHFSQLDHGG